MRSLPRAMVGATLLFLVASAIAVAQTAKRGLPFIEDNYAQALEQARTRKLPLFIEAWAPW